MTPSTLHIVPPPGIHAAILMDGNGRWAELRGLPRSAGHRAGVGAVRRVVEAAPEVGIRTLTLFAFSTNNWQRSPEEVGALFGVLETYLHREALRANEHGVRISVIGRRDRLPSSLLCAIEAAETATARNCELDLRIAVDYSAREAMLRAACWMVSSTEVTHKEFSRRIGQVTHAPGASPDVDLLIRTGGEQRLSDFMIWECAYAELYFTDRMWPDFDAKDLEAAVHEYRARDRRFGRVPIVVPSVLAH
ncbi:MAG TPA: di-trans,poly-cis-decaprenylcistransferase [Candidatus Acidoferrales bacterium]|nr:di-trans,poly-cis-decaprenylcistransferase [Candidatus Acidoferrales bacterium]